MWFVMRLISLPLTDLYFTLDISTITLLLCIDQKHMKTSCTNTKDCKILFKW